LKPVCIRWVRLSPDKPELFQPALAAGFFYLRDPALYFRDRPGSPTVAICLLWKERGFG